MTILAGSIIEAEDVGTDWTPFTPTWTSTGTAPSLGDGTILGRSRTVGRVVHVLIRVTWGSTTTGGTGSWRFGGLPEDRALSNSLLPAMCFDTSASNPYPAAARLNASGTDDIANIGAHSATGAIGQVTATHPFTWANGDVLLITGTYQSAS